MTVYEDTIEYNSFLNFSSAEELLLIQMQGLTDGEKRSAINAHSISLCPLFVGALPALGAEQEEEAESPWDSEVLSVKDVVVPVEGRSYPELVFEFVAAIDEACLLLVASAVCL